MTMTTAFGLYRGLVTNDQDPEGLGRVKAIVPQIFGNDHTQTDWAWPCVPPGTEFTPPTPNSPVWVTFTGGDVNYPIWIGTWSVPGDTAASVTSGMIVVTGLIPNLPGATSPFDNKARIDSVLATATSGSVVFFPEPPSGMVFFTSGNHAVPTGVRVWAGAWNDTLPMFKVISTSTCAAVFASANWLNHVANSDRGVVFSDISIDCNHVPCHGIAFMGKAIFVNHCYIKNWSGAKAGIFTDAATQNGTNNPNVCQENFILFNKIDGTQTGTVAGNYGIWVAHSATNVVTDSDIFMNILVGTGADLIHMDSGGDWWITRNHFYANYSGSVVYINATSGDHINHNQTDSFGFTNANATTNYGFRCIGNPGAFRLEIENNTFSTDETHGAHAADFVYISYTTNVGGGQTVYLKIQDNTIRQFAATSGTSTAYSITNTGGGTLVVALRDEPIMPAPSGSLINTIPVTSGTVVLSNTNTSTSAKVASIVVTSGSAFTPSTNADTAVTVALSGAASGSYSVTFGPSTGAENTIVTGATLPNGVDIIVPVPAVPAGWKVVVTVTNATIGHCMAITR